MPALTFSVAPPRPVAGQMFSIKVTADRTNPKVMGLVVCDLSRKGGKVIRQTFFKGTIGPGHTSTVTFRPVATEDKKLTIRVIAWDKEHPPQKGDDIRKVLFRERRMYTFG